MKRFLRYTFLVCLSSIPMGVAIGHVSSSGWDMVLLLIAWFWSTLVADFRERKF